MSNLYETARSLAVSWAINGPGSFGVLGYGFTEPMDTLLSVFKNSTPSKFRSEARERGGSHDWLDRDAISKMTLEALTLLVNSEELKAMAPNLTGQDMAFLARVSMAVEGSGNDELSSAGEWLQEATKDAGEERDALRDAMAEAARSARAFGEAVTDEVHALTGGDAEPLKAAVHDMKLALDAAEPFSLSKTSALEPALDIAQSALSRYALDGRLMVAFEDKGAVPGFTEAKTLEGALDGLGYEIPAALWMDQDRQSRLILRDQAQQAITASLVFLETAQDPVQIVTEAAFDAKVKLETALADAGYLLPKEAERRTESVAKQTPRGTDEQVIAILAAATGFVQAAGDDIRDALGGQAESLRSGLVQIPYASMRDAVLAVGLESPAAAIDAEIVTGKRPFDFGYITKERIPGVNANDAEPVARRAADQMHNDAHTELTQYVQVEAKNDIEAVARFHQALAANNVARGDVVVMLAEGIETSRLEDIEFGRAEGVLGQNTASMAFTKGEAELVMKLIEAADKIVDKAYAHHESYEDAAFPVSLAAKAVDAARRLETETSVRSTLAHIAAGRRDAIGLSHESADALEKFIGSATDAMKTVVAQDDYIMKMMDEGSETSRLRGEDELPTLDTLTEESNPGKSAVEEAEKKKIIGQTMWDGWADRMEDRDFVKRNFVAALGGDQMTRLIRAHERLASRGSQLAVAAMAGREGAPALVSLAVGVDPAGYGSVQEAMGMGMGGRDGKTKASLMEDKAIAKIMQPTQEMSFDEWRVLSPQTRASLKPYFMEVKVDGHSFPMVRDTEHLAKGEPEYMKKAWAKDLVVAGSGRADLDSESRRLMTAFTKMKKNDDGTPNREFMAFLARLETRPIVAPTKNAAEALRHVSNAYIVGLEQARAAASQKILDDRAKRMADTKMNVIIDRDDAKRLISVWEVGYAADKAAYEAAKDPAEKEALKKKLQMQLPTMTKHETGVMIAHQSLPTVYGRVAEPKTIESLRDGHPITVVDLKAMKQGLAQLGPIWDKLEIKMEGYRVKAYGPHSVEEPKKTLAAADQRMKASEMVI